MYLFFFFNDTATTEIYTLSLHDALPIWNDAAYISAEVRDRRRNMVRALLLSIGIVTLLYLLVNLAYLKGLGYEGMTRSDAVAADLMKRVWGPAGGKLTSVMMPIAALTPVNGPM